MPDPTEFAFSSSSGAAVPLEVCTTAEYVLTGESGIVSWLTPAVSGPDGIRLSYVAMSTRGDVAELMRHHARGELHHDSGVIEASFGAEGSKRMSTTNLHFTKSQHLTSVPTRFTLIVVDDVFGGRWEGSVTIHG